MRQSPSSNVNNGTAQAAVVARLAPSSSVPVRFDDGSPGALDERRSPQALLCTFLI
jgi:hypothetical protein